MIGDLFTSVDVGHEGRVNHGTASAQSRGVRGRNDALLDEGFGGEQLYFEHGVKAVLVGKESGDIFRGVPRNHESLLLFRNIVAEYSTGEGDGVGGLVGHGPSFEPRRRHGRHGEDSTTGGEEVALLVARSTSVKDRHVAAGRGQLTVFTETMNDRPRLGRHRIAGCSHHDGDGVGR